MGLAGGRRGATVSAEVPEVRSDHLDGNTLSRVTSVFSCYAELESVTLFGSHALGTASPRSDIDLATTGMRDRHRLGRLILDLDDLQIPKRCDVRALEEIGYAPLIRHIREAGVVIYRRTGS